MDLDKECRFRLCRQRSDPVLSLSAGLLTSRDAKYSSVAWVNQRVHAGMASVSQESIAIEIVNLAGQSGYYPSLSSRSSVILGGADPERFTPGSGPRRREVIYVDRLLPHKGADILIDAAPSGLPVRSIKRAYGSAYLELLQQKALGKDVTFVLNADDAMVIKAYQAARVVALPSTYRPRTGPPAPKAELLGLALLESMACGTPVICTGVGGMPELVESGVNGYVVEEQDVQLRRCLLRVVDDEMEWARLSAGALRFAQTRGTWTHVAYRCLSAYRAQLSVEPSPR